MKQELLRKLFNITPEQQSAAEAAARAKNGGYLHPEAYCLMYYEHSESKTGFMVWNSRDGVTPFVVHENGKEYKHEHWGMDRRITNQSYIDKNIMVPGQRIFRDTTPEEAREFAIKRLNSAKGTEYEVEKKSDRWNELVASLTESFTGEPNLITLA